MDLQKISHGVRLILEGAGEDIHREELQKTPQRVAEMLQEILNGIHRKPELEAGISETVGDDVISIKDIPFYSMCEHHLLPFFGKVHIAYIPRENRVAGFSSIARVVEIFARRLQIQERFTYQIADTIMEALNPQGVLVLVQAQQLCVSMRGTNKDSVRTETQALRGDMPIDKLHLHRL